MSFRFIYYPAEYERVIPAVIIDKRASIPAISGAIGSVIKAYTDAETAVAKGNLFYKIETAGGDNDVVKSGNLAGYFTLKVTGERTTRLQYELRPAFIQFDTTISTQIANFIASGDWQFDNL